ncbi:MAG: hypothetical protein HN826_11215 [Methylococcales bacterium]|jgi:hypothetical protein|nr:hypothetical protein [Methylococcales bacterium]
MKKMFLIALLLSFSNAHAFGVGVYTHFGSESEDGTQDQTDINGDITSTQAFSSDNDLKGFGFIFDTTLAKDKLLNYRLTVGFENSERNNSTLNGFKGLNMSHTLGFGLIRKEKLRIWAGPEIFFSYYSSFDGDTTADTSSSLTVGNVTGTFTPDNVSIFGYGVGLKAGVNLNIGSHITLSATTGFRTGKYSGEIKDVVKLTNTTTNLSTFITTSAQTYESDATRFYVNLSAMYRFGDKF